MKTIKRRSRKGLCAGPKGGIDGPAAQEMRTLVVAEKGSHNKISSMYFCIGRRATTTHNKISYHIKISSMYFCIREHPQPITSAIENLHWKLFFENYDTISPKNHQIWICIECCTEMRACCPQIKFFNQFWQAKGTCNIIAIYALFWVDFF